MMTSPPIQAKMSNIDLMHLFDFEQNSEALTSGFHITSSQIRFPATRGQQPVMSPTSISQPRKAPDRPKRLKFHWQSTSLDDFATEMGSR